MAGGAASIEHALFVFFVSFVVLDLFVSLRVSSWFQSAGLQTGTTNSHKTTRKKKNREIHESHERRRKRRSLPLPLVESSTEHYAFEITLFCYFILDLDWFDSGAEMSSVDSFYQARSVS